MSTIVMSPIKVRRCKVGVLFNLGSLWLGAHYSDYTRRWCINLLPCLTVWVALPGGRCP